MTCSSTMKLAVCPVSYMDNLQGLYELCRNTGINYSNLDCRFWWQEATHQWLTVRGSINNLVLYMHPVCSNACIQQLSSLVVNACKAWWQSKQIPVKYKYQCSANVVMMCPLSQAMPSPLLRSYILYSEKNFLICDMALSGVVHATCITTAM